MKETRFEFQGLEYYMKKPYRENYENELLLVIDGKEIYKPHKKRHLIPIQTHYNIESGTSTHQRADAIFEFIETNPHSRGLKMLPV